MKKLLAILLVLLTSLSLFSCGRSESESVVNYQEEVATNIQSFVVLSFEDFEKKDVPSLKENVPYLFTIYIEHQYATMLFVPHTSYVLIQFNIKGTNGDDYAI